MSSEPHVAVLTPTFFPVVGGAEMGVHEIYSRVATEMKVTIVTPRVDQLPSTATDMSRQLEEDAPYEVVRFATPAQRLRGIARQLVSLSGIPSVAAIRRLHKASPVDVVNVHFVRPNVIPLLYVRFILRRPTVLSLVGRTDVYHLLSWPEKILLRVAMALATSVTQNSAFYVKGLRESSKVVEIPYGVDFSAYERLVSDPVLPAPGSEIRLVCLQRLVSVKGVDRLIRVLADLPVQYRLAVVGKGPELASLTRLADDIAPGRADFLGYVPEGDIPRVLKDSDIFLFHSLFETFGVVLAQAMAAGLPIVAADTSCISMVVRDGENGFLVPAEDLDAMRKAILRLADDRSLYASISAKNVARARDELNWDVIASRYSELLRSLGPEVLR